MTINSASIILLEAYYACYEKVSKNYFLEGRMDEETYGGGKEKNLVGMGGKEAFQKSSNFQKKLSYLCVLIGKV